MRKQPAYTVYEWREERRAFVCGECGLEVETVGEGMYPPKGWQYCPGCGKEIRFFSLPQEVSWWLEVDYRRM